ncbi:head-tail adaptor protein [Agrobacterium larrymoorei]|uniref:Head-tail adaptor n=1 Tax=Agrobacterium larrymoorei TaxID=160699 RepID=A0ABU0UFB4_9HYPH|nr:head-tail adaptor protein [Agrobacterium larrymoorei]MDQ1183578.1 head-tail adaptor [Agrobacterium larrymoorei]
MVKAGSLRERVVLEKREKTDDGAGNKQSDFQKQFERRAAFIYSRGSEAVNGDGLTGQASFKVKLRKDSQTTLITTAWQVRDARRGTVYAIREADVVTQNDAVFLTVVSGVAS